MNGRDVNDLQTLLPLATGMLLSPLPVVAVVAILLTPRGRASAPVYTAAFTLVSVLVVALGAAGAARASSAGGGEARIVSLILAAVLTVGFAVLAVVSWRSRPRHGEPAVAPSWLAAIDAVTPRSAVGLGLLMAVTNTKNIPLELKAGAVIGEAHLAWPMAAVLCLAVALAGSLLLIAPAIVSLTGSARVHDALQGLKSQLISHNAAMMTVLFAILAANEAAGLLHRLLA